eukprot:618132_1
MRRRTFYKEIIHYLWSSLCVGSIHVVSIHVASPLDVWFQFSIVTFCGHPSVWDQFMLHRRWMCGFNSCCTSVGCVVSILWSSLCVGSIHVVSIHVASPSDVWFQSSIVTFCGHPSVWDQNNRCLKCIHINP